MKFQSYPRHLVALAATSILCFLPLHAENAKLKMPLGTSLPAPGPEVKIEVARKKLRDNMEQQIAEFLKLHNDARAEVGGAAAGLG